jgi:hypothetical protein
LRDYLNSLVALLPIADPLWGSIDAFFDEEAAWVTGLPPVSGLATAPSERSLLDQIADYATGAIESISVLAPYFDEGGAALSELRHRFGVPVMVRLQPGRAGLARVAADALPDGITLSTVDCPPERRPSFIHAKVYGFHRANDVVLAVGSANCSRAGLLATSHWGNAELMVVESVGSEVFTELFADFIQSEATPLLPETTAVEEGEDADSPPLRIVAARHEGERLDLAFKSGEPLSQISIEAEDGVWPATDVDLSKGLAVFSVLRRPRSIVLAGITAAGERLRSSQAWVDDETSLAASASLRRLVQRIHDAAGDASAGEFRAVLDLFRDYLRDPEVSRRRMRRGNREEKPPAPYDPAAVFSEQFGRNAGPMARLAAFSFERKSVLAIIEALFAVSSGAASTPRDPDMSGEEPDPAAEEEKLVPRRKAPSEPKVAERLGRALKNVEAALLEPQFTAARPPELLGADIALAAILLVKGLADGHLEIELYRTVTRRLWSELFFGPKGDGSGSIARRLEAFETDERNAFIAGLASPKLSAALTIWSLKEWYADDADALWFRVSAAQLQYRHPWLFASASPEAVAAELESQASSLLLPNEQTLVNAAWVGLIRMGQALWLLYQALASFTHLELVRKVTAEEVDARTLLWQANTLAFPIRAYRRQPTVHAEVRFVGDDTIRKFKGDHLVPVQDLLASEVVNLPTLAINEIGRFIDAASHGIWGVPGGPRASQITRLY